MIYSNNFHYDRRKLKYKESYINQGGITIPCYKKFISPRVTLSFDKSGRYYKNDEKLINTEGDVFTEHDFKQLVREESSNFINNNFSNIIVLIGAGASVVTNDESIDSKFGKTVLMLGKEAYKQLIDGSYTFLNGIESEVFTLEELSVKANYRTSIVEEIEEDGKPILKLDSTFNLEEFLSNLLSYKNFVNEAESIKLNNSIEAILEIIKKATNYDYDNKVFKHIRFLNIMNRLVKKERKLNIITTNYDTLIEDAAEKMKLTVLDGFSFSQTPRFDSSMFDWHFVKDARNITTNEKIYKTGVLNLLKIHGSLSWEEYGDSIIRKNKSNVEKPVMVFPSSDKYAQSYQEPYFELFSKFQELLKQPNTLFITVGFSYFDNHISKMILRAIENNDSLHVLVTDYDIEPKHPNENWKELVQKMENLYQIAFLGATMNDDLTYYLGGNYDDR